MKPTKTPPVGTRPWNLETVYHAGDEVTHGGKRYQARFYSLGEAPDFNCEDPNASSPSGHTWRIV